MTYCHRRPLSIRSIYRPAYRPKGFCNMRNQYDLSLPKVWQQDRVLTGVVWLEVTISFFFVTCICSNSNMMAWLMENTWVCVSSHINTSQINLSQTSMVPINSIPNPPSRLFLVIFTLCFSGCDGRPRMDWSPPIVTEGALFFLTSFSHIFSFLHGFQRLSCFLTFLEKDPIGLKVLATQ